MNAKEAAEQDAEVEAYRASPDLTLWRIKVSAQLSPGPSGYTRHLARVKERETAQRNAATARRNAAKMNRTPAWADDAAIRRVYAMARRLTKLTGIEHHVDHILPLQGVLVSGFHIHTNLQILTASENCSKRNHYEVEA